MFYHFLNISSSHLIFKNFLHITCIIVIIIFHHIILSPSLISFSKSYMLAIFIIIATHTLNPLSQLIFQTILLWMPCILKSQCRTCCHILHNLIQFLFCIVFQFFNDDHLCNQTRCCTFVFKNSTACMLSSKCLYLHDVAYPVMLLIITCSLNRVY